MKCRTLVLLAVAVAVAVAQYPYSEAQLRDLPNRYGNSFFETINPVGTAVLLQNQLPLPGFNQPQQTEWLTIYDNPAATIATQSCGNGIREGYELCDTLASWLTDPLCTALGFNPLVSTQIAGCGLDCTWDRQGLNNWQCGGTVASPTGNCGNGVIDAYEQCDFTTDGLMTPITGGATCESVGLGFTGGVLGCSYYPFQTPPIPTCSFDFSHCTRSTPGCGDGILEGVEQCDPPGSRAACASIGLGAGPPTASGTAICSPTCDWDVGFCYPYGQQTTTNYQAATPSPIAEPPLCGNNIVDPTEQCDGSNVQGQTCSSLGFGQGGMLGCSGCRYDVRGCRTQGGLVTVAAIGPNVTQVAVGDVVALNPTAKCVPFGLNNFVENQQQYCIVDQSNIAVTLQEGNLFFDKSDVTTQAGFRSSIPQSGDLEARTNF